MSIEAILTRVAEALEANTAAMTKMIEGAGGKAPASKPAEKKTESKKTESKKDEGYTKQGIADELTAFLKTGDKDTRAENKAKVLSIAEYFGADRFTNIPEDDWPEAMGYFAEVKAGKTPKFDGPEDGDNDDVV